MSGPARPILCGFAIAIAALVAPAATQTPPSQRVGQPPPPAVAVQTRGITWDFETGTLAGWTPQGTAFENQPTLGDNPAARGRESANMQGKYWIGTLELYDGRVGKPGATRGDRHIGTLTSIAFRIPQTLTFRIGGGSSRATRVELLLDDSIEGNPQLVAASGRNSETMSDVTWNLGQWAGRMGRVRIVDEATGAWGHINADDFRFGLRVPRGGLEFTQPAGGQRQPPPPPPKPASVPNLNRLTEQQALSALRGAGLVPGRVQRLVNESPEYLVYWQEFPPGTSVSVGTAVSFNIALPIPVRPPALVPVPNLIGVKRESDAADILARAGLQKGQVSRKGSLAPFGEVIDQTTTPGAMVPPGTAIDFTTATTMRVRVPDLTGLSRSDAEAVLAKSRLAAGQVTAREDRASQGSVISQTQVAGSVVDIGTRIDFATAIPITVLVPQLVGRTGLDAVSELKRLELLPGKPQTRETRDAAPGTVISQTVPPGKRVDIGTTVDFVTATPVTTLVPPLVGLMETAAVAELRRFDLVPGKPQVQQIRNVEPGTVLSQAVPPKQRVEVGTTIGFTIATPVTVEIPRLLDRRQEDAAAQLRRLELVPVDRGPEESRKPEGTVISQDPAPGTIVVIGTRVSYSTARPVTVLVPDLIGRSDGEARKLLTELELDVGTVTTEQARSPVGSVLRQSIAPRTQVNIGTTVAFVTATPVMVRVPSLTGLTEEQARDALAARELIVGTSRPEESPAPRGTVLSQGTPVDRLVPIGTAIDVVVAAIETTLMPELVGLTLDAARQVLAASRLVAGAEQLRESRTTARGIVLAQPIARGTRVAIGTAIALTVATPEMVPVPGLEGLAHDAAVSAIRDVGLTLGTVDYGISWRWPPGGTVISQVQPVGERVEFGAAVAVTEARSRLVLGIPAAVALLGLVGFFFRGGLQRVDDGPVGGAQVDPEIPPVHVSAVPHVDIGAMDISVDGDRVVRSETVVRPVSDAGVQNIETSPDVIRAERRMPDGGTTLPED